MSKRSSGFKRSKNDLYDTPAKGVLPLLPFLRPGTRFIEPCFGNGYLTEHLQAHDHICVGGYDIEPRFPDIIKADARTSDYPSEDCFITNPPWTRRFEIGRTANGKIIWEEVLHPLIINLSRQLPCWLLFDADWAHTNQAATIIQTCSHVVSVGRLKWIEGTKYQGKDNCAWYRFDAAHIDGPRFFGCGQTVEKPADEIEARSYQPPSTLDPQELHHQNSALFQRALSDLSPLSGHIYNSHIERF